VAKKKKNTSKRKLVLILSLAGLIAVLVLSFIFRRPIIYYSKIVYHKAFVKEDKDNFKNHKSTNLNGDIYVPDFEVYGIDISRHQGDINWDALRKFRFQYHKIDFVYIKATESNSYQDKFYKSNWKHAKKYGFHRGAYHFFDPMESPEEQMNYFFRKVKLSKGDLPPMLDVEQESRISTSKYRQKVLRCLQLMENHYKMKPILYVNQNFYDSYFDNADFAKYPLWISRLKKSKPSQDNWVLWQFTHTAVIDGIGEYVDLNAFNGSAFDFKVLLKD
jgi:lysozyme